MIERFRWWLGLKILGESNLRELYQRARHQVVIEKIRDVLTFGEPYEEEDETESTRFH